jgi:prolyl 4-hydroxylase
VSVPAKAKAQEISALRAETGKSVLRRLSRNPRVQTVAGVGCDLHIIQDFLSVDECVALIMMIEALKAPSLVLSEDQGDFRTSYSSNLDRYHPLVEAIDTRICDLMGIKPRHGETLQGQRYAPGQYFQPHQDYFHSDKSYFADMRKTGGQRTWTAMIYLNEPGGGGETNFLTAGLSVTPRTGMLMMWNNMDSKGAPNPSTMHEGAAVISGVKFIVTKWFREHFWF